MSIKIVIFGLATIRKKEMGKDHIVNWENISREERGRVKNYWPKTFIPLKINKKKNLP